LGQKSDSTSKAHSNGAGKRSGRKAGGWLIAIGGGEDKRGERSILREVAARAGSGRLVIATLASEMAAQQWATYRRVFTELGVKHIRQLDIKRRDEAAAKVQALDGATAVFFTGGDQIKLTAKIAGTEIAKRVAAIYAAGGTVAGTSAGAAALSQTMLVGGRVVDTHKVASAFFTATGLGLLRDVIIDQHFAQRSRIGRLLGVVGENPGLLGIGIDEDTGVLFDADRGFEVIGSGAVYVVDGSGITYSNVSERALERTMALFDVRLHVLKSGNSFDLSTRTPSVISRPEESRAIGTSNVEEDAVQDGTT
jgi:cyanophycinase